MATALANPVGVFARESVAELRKNLRLPQFALPTIITPAVFYGLFAIALNKGGPDGAAYSLATSACSPPPARLCSASALASRSSARAG